jgi:hypothetical protein
MDLVLVSAVAGAMVLTILAEISLKLTNRGDPSGPVVGLVFYLLVLGVLGSVDVRHGPPPRLRLVVSAHEVVGRPVRP